MSSRQASEGSFRFDCRTILVITSRGLPSSPERTRRIASRFSGS